MTLKPKAAPVPTAISVNMLGERLTIDCQPRWKIGQPKNMTSVAKTNWNQRREVGVVQCSSGLPGSISVIATMKIGSVKARQIQKRRDMSTSSTFGGSSAVMVCGSKAMPQIGHVPGPFCTISGCIGQV